MNVRNLSFFLEYYMAKQKIKVAREEMLQVAANVAHEKNIEQDDVFIAIIKRMESQIVFLNTSCIDRLFRIIINNIRLSIKLNHAPLVCINIICINKINVIVEYFTHS